MIQEEERTTLRFFRKPALAASQVERLLDIVNAEMITKVATVVAEWCFYIETSGALTPSELARLRWLLAETFEPQNFGGASFLSYCPTVLEVGPRLNFETSFSTTAVAICRACGLDKVLRVERSLRCGLDVHLSEDGNERFLVSLHDRMTQMRYREPLASFTTTLSPESGQTIRVLAGDWRENLQKFSRNRGIGWDDQDLEFVRWLFQDVLRRDATDAELFQLGQANSEHSRHWRFKGDWVIDGVRMPKSLMELIKAPLEARPSNSVIAFHDDSSAIRGGEVMVLISADSTRPSPFLIRSRVLHPTLTAETHNHPIMVEPYQGAMTKVGGLFRDQIVVGRGGRIGVCGIGFAVANLNIPGYTLPWEEDGWLPPGRIATPLQVALRGSDGDFDYGNCFGQPVVYGFFRTFGMKLPDGSYRAWFKPVGYGAAGGSVDDVHVSKGSAEHGMLVGLVGGPAYRIGVGGGSASSMMGGENTGELDFASVQRGDPEMENRLSRFMLACVEQLEENPIVSSHDLGAGGLSNAAPEIVDPKGAVISLRAIPSGDPSLSALELHGNEAQERNIILARPDGKDRIGTIAEREGVPLTVIGEVSGDGRYVLSDESTGRTPVDLPLREILGNLPPKTFTDRRIPPKLKPLRLPENLTALAALDRVLRLPSVGSKQWLTRKVDRSVTGLVAQQQCVGPNHLPVADFAIKADGYFGLTGVAYSLGEQPIKGFISPEAMVRLAVAEALLNMAGARITDFSHIKGSANWMLAAKLPGQGAWLCDAVKALSEFWAQLGIAADGGKDSLSMAVMAKSPAGEDVIVAAPGEFVFAAYATMPDITRKVTPDLSPGEVLLFVDLGEGHHPLGGSALAQVFGQLGDAAPDIKDASLLQRTFGAVQRLLDERAIESLHDRSDGGLIVTLLEMAFAGNTGLDIALTGDSPILAALFSEEPGLVIGCDRDRVRDVHRVLETFGLATVEIGATYPEHRIRICHNGKEALDQPFAELRAMWEETSYRLDALQADPECVNSERSATVALTTPPPYRLTFRPSVRMPSAARRRAKPKMAIVRERGSNGDREMAAAFTVAGFEAWDVTMRDLRNGFTLDMFQGLAFPGGFAFADVFDAGKGWAGVIRFNDRIREQFERFRERQDTFALGVCNGCQLMALLGWVPGLEVKPEEQPRFIRNRSGRFESRFPGLRVEPSPAVMLAGMAGSTLGVWVAHGEGCFRAPSLIAKTVISWDLAPLRYAGSENGPTEVYPFNPNGSPGGVAGLCSPDGRFLAMMPHPERTFLKWQWPWMPLEWEHHPASPWLKLFQNAYEWCVGVR